MSPYAIHQLKRFLRWVRLHETTWSYIHVSGIALKLDGYWLCPSIRLVLTDSRKVSGALGKSVFRAGPVLGFRVSVQSDRLRELMSAMWKGKIERQMLPQLPGALATRFDDEKPPEQLHLNDRLSFDSKIAGEAGWPRYELECEGPTLSAWCQKKANRGEWLQDLERRFKVHGFGSVGDLAMRLGLPLSSAGHLAGEHFKHSVVAPLRARLRGAKHDRIADCLVATVDVGHRVDREKLRLVVSQPMSGKVPRRPARLSGAGESERIVYEAPVAGAADVSLCHRDIGEIATARLHVEPPLLVSPRVVIYRQLDPDLVQLTADVASRNPAQHERGISILLVLLGYAALWSPRELPQPKGVASGKHAVDIPVFAGGGRSAYIVECTTDWPPDAKVLKLVKRTNLANKTLGVEIGAQAPHVRGIMVVAQSRDDVPAGVRLTVRRNRVGLMTNEDALSLVDDLKAGYPLRELARRVEARFEEGLFGVTDDDDDEGD
jgi:hypothetical protein